MAYCHSCSCSAQPLLLGLAPRSTASCMLQQRQPWQSCSSCRCMRWRGERLLPLSLVQAPGQQCNSSLLALTHNACHSHARLAWHATHIASQIFSKQMQPMPLMRAA